MGITSSSQGPDDASPASQAHAGQDPADDKAGLIGSVKKQLMGGINRATAVFTADGASVQSNAFRSDRRT